MLKAALDTLFAVLFTMVRVMAPFTPFLTEMMYQQLRKKAPQFAGAESNSVHYLMLPVARADLIHEDIERAVGRMQAVVDLGRVLRDRKTMPVKIFLPVFRKKLRKTPYFVKYLHNTLSHGGFLSVTFNIFCISFILCAPSKR
jgi:valyl-tRNA synthetase